MRTATSVPALGALLVMLAGCKDSTPFELPADRGALRPTSIVPTSPTAFHAPPRSRVAAPEIVILDQNGNRVANLSVRFTVVSGGGSVAHEVAATDAEGRATAGDWVLGPEPGVNLVVATMDTFAVAFMAIAGLEPVEAVYGLARIDNQRVPTRGGAMGGYYILYEDGTFRRGSVSGGVEAPIWTGLEVGVYSREGSGITFLEQQGRSWSGSLQGDSLHIWIGDVYDSLHGTGRSVFLEVYARTPLASASAKFPPVTRPAAIFERTSPHTYPSGALSRYLIYPDSTFALQYLTPRFGIGEYTGRYSRAGSRVTFRFHNRGPVWEATGTLRDRELIVEYNLFMAMSDFEDGVYVRAPDQATDAAHLYLANADGSASRDSRPAPGLPGRRTARRSPSIGRTVTST